MKLFTKSVLFFVAALFSASMAFAEFYEAPAVEPQPSEAYISFDMSRLDGWAFPKYVLTGAEVSVPYSVYTYMGELNNVVVTLMVNGQEAAKQEVGNVSFDEDYGEGVYTGKFTYTAAELGDLNIQLILSYDGSELNEGENETEEVTIAVSDTAPEAPVLANIAALKAYEAQGKEDVVLTLTDAKVTYVGSFEGYDDMTFEPTTFDVVVFEDATGGIMWQGSGLGTLVTAGQVLNGKLALNVESVWGDISAKLTNGLDGVTATDGTVTPLALNDDNVLEYLEAPDWRLIELKNVTLNVVSGEYSDDVYVVSDQIGEIALQDVVGTGIMPENMDGVYNMTGYIYSIWGGMITAFQIVSMEEIPVVENIAAMKTLEVEDAKDVLLKLTDAKVTYVGTVNGYDDDFEPVALDVVIFEDATGGIMWQGSGLGTLVTAGQVLNGKLALNVMSVWGDISAKLTSGLDGVTATDGTVTPLTLNDGNVLEYLEAPDWRLVEIHNVTFNIVPGDYGDDVYVVSDLLDELGLLDVLGIDLTPYAEAGRADAITGYVYSLYGGFITAFQPLTVRNLTTGIKEMKADVAAGNATVYNMQGVRVNSAKKGLFIVNGKKVVVK